SAGCPEVEGALWRIEEDRRAEWQGIGELGAIQLPLDPRTAAADEERDAASAAQDAVGNIDPEETFQPVAEKQRYDAGDDPHALGDEVRRRGELHLSCGEKRRLERRRGRERE